MKNTSHLISQDYSSLIGIPYEVKDCWGVAREFYLLHGIVLKDYYDKIPNDNKVAKELVDSNAKDYEEVIGDLLYGDLLLLKLEGVACHIAVYVGEGKILHTSKKTGCMIDKFHRWQRSFVKAYRVKLDEY